MLVACEFSGIVTGAFRRLGHRAFSCDLLPTEGEPRWHIQDDVLEVFRRGRWDLIIAFPPCTRLAVSGARWFAQYRTEQELAVAFFMAMVDAPAEKVAIENPVSIMSTRYRPPDQIVQPHWFGHGETKATCLWLKGLPLLRPTRKVRGRQARVHLEPPSPDRWKNRSRTRPGIGRAMASQWGAS